MNKLCSLLLFVASFTQDAVAVICKTKASTTIYCDTDCCGTKCCEENYIPIYVGWSVAGITLIVVIIASIYACAKTNFMSSWILSPSSITREKECSPEYSASTPQGHIDCLTVSPDPPAYTERQLPPPSYTARSST